MSGPTLSLWASTTVNFTLPYFCTSLALNIVSTIFIVARLLYFRYRISSSLGPGYGTQYTTIAAMIVESAAVYSISSLLFLVPFIVNHPIQNVFLGMLSPAQVNFVVWSFPLECTSYILAGHCPSVDHMACGRRKGLVSTHCSSHHFIEPSSSSQNG